MRRPPRSPGDAPPSRRAANSCWTCSASMRSWARAVACPRGCAAGAPASRLLTTHVLPEADRTMYYNTSQWTMKQNTQTLAAMQASRSRPGSLLLLLTGASRSSSSPRRKRRRS